MNVYRYLKYKSNIGNFIITKLFYRTHFIFPRQQVLIRNYNKYNLGAKGININIPNRTYLQHQLRKLPDYQLFS